MRLLNLFAARPRSPIAALPQEQAKSTPEKDGTHWSRTRGIGSIFIVSLSPEVQANARVQLRCNVFGFLCEQSLEPRKSTSFQSQPVSTAAAGTKLR